MRLPATQLFLPFTLLCFGTMKEKKRKFALLGFNYIVKLDQVSTKYQAMLVLYVEKKRSKKTKRTLAGI